MFVAGGVFDGLLHKYSIVRYHALEVVVDDIEFEITLCIGFANTHNQVFVVCLQVVFIRTEIAIAVVELGDGDFASFGFHRWLQGFSIHEIHNLYLHAGVGKRPHSSRIAGPAIHHAATEGRHGRFE